MMWENAVETVKIIDKTKKIHGLYKRNQIDWKLKPPTNSTSAEPEKLQASNAPSYMSSTSNLYFHAQFLWRLEDLTTIGDAQSGGAVAMGIPIRAVGLVLPLGNGTPPGDGAFHLEDWY